MIVRSRISGISRLLHAGQVREMHQSKTYAAVIKAVYSANSKIGNFVEENCSCGKLKSSITPCSGSAGVLKVLD